MISLIINMIYICVKDTKHEYTVFQYNTHSVSAKNNVWKPADHKN